jgi:hypothetical protein
LARAIAPVIGRDDRGAHDVGRHQIRRELDARELQRENLGKRADEHGFAQPGNAFEQGIAADHQAEDGLGDDLLVADDDLAGLGFDGVVTIFEVVDLGFNFGGGRDGGDASGHGLLLRGVFLSMVT